MRNDSAASELPAHADVTGTDALRYPSPALAGVIATAALISGLLIFVYLPGAQLGGKDEPLAIARALASGKGYSDAYGDSGTQPGAPTAHLAPLFPLFLAALMRLFGPTLLFVAAAVAVCSAAHVLHALLLAPASQVLTGSSRAGLWAAALFILVPPVLFLPQWEAIYAATGLMAFCLASDRWIGRSGNDKAAAARCGAAAGILALLNPSTLLVAAPWVLWRLRQAAASAARCVRFLVLAAFFGGLVLAPWALRNWLVLGSPVWFRSNLGLELAVSNNPWAAPSQVENFDNPVAAQLHPVFSRRLRAEIMREGEVAFNRRKMAEALQWIRANPGAFLRLTARRAAQFWWPLHERSRFHLIAVRLVTLLGAGGLVLMMVHRRPCVWFLLAASLCYSSLYCLVHTTTRHRFPIMWLSLLPAGYLLDWLSRRAAELCRGTASAGERRAPRTECGARLEVFHGSPGA